MNLEVTRMALVEWNETLSVGVPEMDQQHNKLVNLINQLYDAMHLGKGDEVKNAILIDLITYSKVHFTAEERLMQQYGYPDFAGHKRLHDDLTAQAVQLKQRLDAGQTVASVTLANFLRDWLRKHITQVDKQYGQFICAGAGV